MISGGLRNNPGMPPVTLDVWDGQVWVDLALRFLGRELFPTGDAEPAVWGARLGSVALLTDTNAGLLPLAAGGQRATGGQGGG